MACLGGGLLIPELDKKSHKLLIFILSRISGSRSV